MSGFRNRLARQRNKTGRAAKMRGAICVAATPYSFVANFLSHYAGAATIDAAFVRLFESDEFLHMRVACGCAFVRCRVRIAISCCFNFAKMRSVTDGFFRCATLVRHDSRCGWARNAMTKVPVFETVLNSFTGAWAAFRSIPLQFFAAFVLFGAIDLLTEHVLYRMGDYYVQAQKDFVRDLLGLLFSVAVIPFAIAVHRFNLLGERMGFAATLANGDRFARYALWSVGLSVFLVVPSLLMYLFPSQAWAAVLGLAILIFGVLLLIVAIPLFSAIALDDPEAGFNRAARAVRGNRWRLFSGMLLVLVILMLLLLPPMLYRWALAESGNFIPLSFAGFAFSVVIGAVIVALYGVATIFCNEAYRRLWRQ